MSHTLNHTSHLSKALAHAMRTIWCVCIRLVVASKAACRSIRLDPPQYPLNVLEILVSLITRGRIESTMQIVALASRALDCQEVASGWDSYSRVTREWPSLELRKCTSSTCHIFNPHNSPTTSASTPRHFNAVECLFLRLQQVATGPWKIIAAQGHHVVQHIQLRMIGSSQDTFNSLQSRSVVKSFLHSSISIGNHTAVVTPVCFAVLRLPGK
eukprot:5964759-Amphidinium_carterae.1